MRTKWVSKKELHKRLEYQAALASTRYTALTDEQTKVRQLEVDRDLFLADLCVIYPDLRKLLPTYSKEGIQRVIHDAAEYGRTSGEPKGKRLFNILTHADQNVPMPKTDSK